MYYEIPEGFGIGRQIRCINDVPGPGDAKALTSGKIYTIKSVEFLVHPEEGPLMGVHLEEVKRPISRKYGKHIPFNSSRFVPVLHW